MSELSKCLPKVSIVKDRMSLEERSKLNDDPIVSSMVVAAPAFSDDRNSHRSTTIHPPEKRRPGGSKWRQVETIHQTRCRWRGLGFSQYVVNKVTRANLSRAGDAPKTPRKTPRCSVCGLTGHRKNTCSKPLVSWLCSLHTGTTSVWLIWSCTYRTNHWNVVLLNFR